MDTRIHSIDFYPIRSPTQSVRMGISSGRLHFRFDWQQTFATKHKQQPDSVTSGRTQSETTRI